MIHVRSPAPSPAPSRISRSSPIDEVWCEIELILAGLHGFTHLPRSELQAEEYANNMAQVFGRYVRDQAIASFRHSLQAAVRLEMVTVAV